MSDDKKPSYQMAYDERLKQLDSSMHTEHRAPTQSRDEQVEVKPTRDSIQLGEGSHR